MLVVVGRAQADVWVSSFPSQVMVLVDAVVWTQTVSTALARVADGERMALRNLLDQMVLRLEGLAQQLRGTLASASSASAVLGASSRSEESAEPSSPGADAASLDGQHVPGVHALRALIASGVAHRQVRLRCASSALL